MDNMSTGKIDIIWSPVHHDKFIVWGQDITLYEEARIKDIEKKTFTPISSTRGAVVIASHNANGVRCVDISAIADQPDPILALGHASGRILLTSLKQAYDPLGLVGREFSARYPRACNALAWNHTESNLLAVGMDKHRADNCIMLWDMNTCGTEEFTGESSSPGAPEGGRAAAELGAGEAAHALAWCGFAPRTLLASMNMKHIKIFDLREGGGKAAGWAPSRQCLGVCAEPRGFRLASRGDSAVCVWDARALALPLLTLPQPRPLRKLQWCPTRRNLLLSLQRDSNTLRLHDIQQANDYKSQQSFDSAVSWAFLSTLTNYLYNVVERDVAPAAHPLLAFACHPEHRARLLALTSTGSMVEYRISERVTVSWGASGALAWAGGGALRALRPLARSQGTDLAEVMRRRATTDYGLKADLWQNAELAEDEALSGLWHFLALSKSLVEDGCIRNSPWKHPGVRTVLRAAGDGAYRSEAVPSLLPDMPNRKLIVYRSAERTRALQLCGWGWGWENAMAGVERAEAEGTPCRAAALAAFQLRARAALDVLARARSPRLRVAALALLAAPQPPDERLWRDALAAAAPALPDPYLRALLHFLAASAAPASAAQPDFAPVLAETGMRLEDRVAFACVYLSDARLHDYVQATADQLLQQGDLAGVLLTGISPEGVSLLQRWLERSGDVQSGALLAARCCPPELLRDPRVAHWLDSYRSLLDSWQLWWARCALDTWVCAGLGEGAGGGGGGGGGAGGGAGGGGGPDARRVGVACTYCGKSVAAAASARPRPAFARLPPPAAKMKQISSCPNCRKPLPRCGVCSLHLGTSAVGGAGAVGGAHFAGWFSWCVACRHGGHAAHLLDWFSNHTECPVSSCSCRCSSLDPPDRDNMDI
ncbi:GATOR complex protein MIOS-B [Zerene cesonia]|uniref:GATOR complex protein MIOS-B n=1 Tax=Zerene cesonia TaxID=33412 RepID=UPI0018E4F174|nr:GATOR complex protein MIOS-B [Zerene cesonia]